MHLRLDKTNAESFISPSSPPPSPSLPSQEMVPDMQAKHSGGIQMAISLTTTTYHPICWQVLWTSPPKHIPNPLHRNHHSPSTLATCRDVCGQQSASPPPTLGSLQPICHTAAKVQCVHIFIVR